MNKTKPSIFDKESIRSEVKQRISLLSGEEKNKAALSLGEKLLNSAIIKGTGNIISYEAGSDEVSLTPFLEEAKKQGKNIFTIDSRGNYNSLPIQGIIFIPGRAFTLSGKRIGRGGGWYDSFLREHPNFYTIGVCFECQIFPDLPQDTWDISMDEVIVGKIETDEG